MRLYDITFPFLNRLCLTSELDPITILELSHARLPVLRRMDVYFSHRSDPTSYYDFIDLPLPRTLRLGSYHGVNVMPIVNRYGRFLKSLDYTISRDTSFLQQYIVSLPQLEILAFNDLGKEKPPITMITPRLKVLVTSTSYVSASFPLEMNLGLLTHVRTDGKQVPPLLELSGLKVLHMFPDSARYDKIFKLLVEHPSVCRELGTVEVRLRNPSDANRSNFQNLFLRINGARESHIEHFIHSRFTPWHEVLPQNEHYTVSDSSDLSLLVTLTFG
jgi:hypothetical protein